MALRKRHGFKTWGLWLVAGTAAFATFWFGIVPQSWSPFPRLDLASPSPWFLDFRLAALRRDRGACAAALVRPVIASVPIVDYTEAAKGCGWTNAVSMSSAGGAEIGAAQITCEAAAALAMWMQHEVQPLAEKHFGSRVVRAGSMGTYSCRNIIGRKFFANVRSQHATANAIDIAGFKLANGDWISVARDWKGGGKKSAFLREAHRRACAYFRVALSPEFNAAHHDHLHLDRGYMWRCK